MEIRNHQYPSASPLFQPINPLPQSLPNPTPTEHQVHRWANWVKFVAAFMIIGSSLNFLRILFLFFFSTEISTSILIQASAIHFIHFVTGFIGYRSALNKSLQGAKTMLTNIIIGIISSTIFIVNILTEVFMSLCKFQGGECSKEEISHLAFMYGLYFLLFSMIICSPVIYCLEMLIKHATISELTNRPVYSNQVNENRPGNSYYFSRV